MCPFCIENTHSLTEDSPRAPCRKQAVGSPWGNSAQGIYWAYCPLGSLWPVAYMGPLGPPGGPICLQTLIISCKHVGSALQRGLFMPEGWAAVDPCIPHLSMGLYKAQIRTWCMHVIYNFRVFSSTWTPKSLFFKRPNLSHHVFLFLTP